MLGNYGSLFFIKIIFYKTSYTNTTIMSNSLETDQDRHVVGPDLNPICLQR